MTGFADSSLNIVGTLSAKLFIANGIGARVGDGALIDYGIGSWSGLEDGGAPLGAPRHDARATIAALRPQPRPEGYPYDAEDIAALIRAGAPISSEGRSDLEYSGRTICHSRYSGGRQWSGFSLPFSFCSWCRGRRWRR